jgi:hypothetical protein
MSGVQSRQFCTDERCRRCDATLDASTAAEETDDFAPHSVDARHTHRFGTFRQRAVITVIVLICTLIALHLSLLFTSDPDHRRRTTGVMRAVKRARKARLRG